MVFPFAWPYEFFSVIWFLCHFQQFIGHAFIESDLSALMEINSQAILP